jgi:hypothetical protein
MEPHVENLETKEGIKVRDATGSTDEDIVGTMVVRIKAVVGHDLISRNVLVAVMEVFEEVLPKVGPSPLVPTSPLAPFSLNKLSTLLFDKGCYYTDGKRIRDKDVSTIWDIAFGTTSTSSNSNPSSGMVTLQTHIDVAQIPNFKFPGAGTFNRQDGPSLAALYRLEKTYQLKPSTLDVHLHTVLDEPWLATIQSICSHNGYPDPDHLTPGASTLTSNIIFSLWKFAVQPHTSATYLKMITEALFTTSGRTAIRKHHFAHENTQICEYPSAFAQVVYTSFLEHLETFKHLLKILNKFVRASALPPVLQSTPGTPASIFDGRGIRQDCVNSLWDAFLRTFIYMPYLVNIYYRRLRPEQKDQLKTNPDIYQVIAIVKDHVDQDYQDSLRTKTLSGNLQGLSHHASKFLEAADTTGPTYPRPVLQSAVPPVIQPAPPKPPPPPYHVRPPYRPAPVSGQQASHLQHMQAEYSRLPTHDDWLASQYSHLSTEDQHAYLRYTLPHVISHVYDTTPYDTSSPLYPFRFDDSYDAARHTDRSSFVHAMRDFSPNALSSTAPPPYPCFKEAVKPGTCRDKACKYSHEPSVLDKFRKTPQFADLKQQRYAQLQHELSFLTDPPDPPPAEEEQSRQEQKQAPQVDLSMWSTPQDNVDEDLDAEEYYQLFAQLDTESQRTVLQHTQALAAQKAHNLMVRQGNISFSGRPRL